MVCMVYMGLLSSIFLIILLRNRIKYKVVLSIYYYICIYYYILSELYELYVYNQ